ncbi:MAG: hypothetical protein ACOC2U_04710, partial [bacterium]
ISIENNNWRAGKIEQDDFTVINPHIIKSNIKLFYVFLKKLPFNSRFNVPISFVHANGVILTIQGNDKEVAEISPNNIGAEDQLPKALVIIKVPVLEKFDITMSDISYISKIISSDIPEEKRNEYYKLYEKELSRKKKIEKTEYNNSIGLELNEMEYKALWALNSFIREYARKFGEKKIKGFSVSEFKDGLGFDKVYKLENVNFQTSSFIKHYNDRKLNQKHIASFYNSFLSFQELSISDFTEYQLYHLNYGFATIGMYQQFESLWEEFSPNKDNKWIFIENYSSNPEIMKSLAEMINARNNIIHKKNIETKHSERNRLRTDWNAERLNEFEIFALKKPWIWYKDLRRFTELYNTMTE